MKIVKRIRDIYEESKGRYDRLAKEVREVLKPRVEERGWFFLSRVKDLESFALKIETGRVPDPAKMEDFFGGTIVVPIMSDIEQAENLVKSLYDFSSRRPPNDTSTFKSSSDFAFDDLRLYVARRSLVSGKDVDLEGIVFEIQIKTILQHAWSVATHDLIYKSDTVSWPRERIAFQVKAMLEHAEIAISEANRLADAPAVAKKDGRTDNVLKIIEEVERMWPRERLPKDIKRLAVTLFELLRSCDLTANGLSALVEAEKRRVGLLPADLSPYALTVQALANSRNVDFKRLFNRGHIRTRLVIHDDMELPDWMRADHLRILNVG